MSKRSKSIDRAMKRAKKAFDGECVFCGQSPVDGAHILARDKYSQYVDFEFNIIPLCRKHHVLFDDENGHETSPFRRIRALHRHSGIMVRNRVRMRLRLLYEAHKEWYRNV